MGQNLVSSLKLAQNKDEKVLNRISSLKIAQNKDERVLNRGSSLKTGDNKDENRGPSRKEIPDQAQDEECQARDEEG